MKNTITKVIEWDMGHRIPNHKSKCKNLHGHRYRLEITISGPLCNISGNSSEGMVLDFSDIKRIMMERVHDLYDHSFMWYIHDPILKKAFPILDKQNQKMVIVEFIPTVENICQLIFNNMKKELKDSGLVVEKAKLFETPNSWAEAINNS